MFILRDKLFIVSNTKKNKLLGFIHDKVEGPSIIIPACSISRLPRVIKRQRLRKEQELGPSKGAVKSLSTEEQLNNSNLAIENHVVCSLLSHLKPIVFPPSAYVSRALFPKTITSSFPTIASYSLRRFSTGNKVGHKLKLEVLFYLFFGGIVLAMSCLGPFSWGAWE
ncbi:Transposase [Fusarium oxysporum f. sp. albedinis]|nr:Transposase [Fusarium oxysporum f. sp. albedinis]